MSNRIETAIAIAFFGTIAIAKAIFQLLLLLLVLLRHHPELLLLPLLTIFTIAHVCSMHILFFKIEAFEGALNHVNQGKGMY